MDPAEQHPRLRLLSEAELAEDRFPDEPFRLTFPSHWNDGPDGVRRRSDIAVRLNSADLADLKAQIRAQELALHARISRKSPEEIVAEQRRAATQAAYHMTKRPEIELLETVLVRLREVA